MELHQVGPAVHLAEGPLNDGRKVAGYLNRGSQDPTGRVEVPYLKGSKEG